jgi:peptidoglycan/xylan/chitin deacetylase (PgdA/CDA1 family)
MPTADSPLRDLTAGTLISKDDLFHTLDVSDSTYHATGTDKKNTAEVVETYFTAYNSVALRTPMPNFTWYETLDSGWSDWYTNGTVAHDSSDKIGGTASIKIIAANDESICGMEKNITDVDLSSTGLRVWVKCDDWASVSQADILVSTSGAFDAFYACNVKSKLANQVDDEWQELFLSHSDFIVGAGAPDWADANDIILRVIAVAGQTPSVWFDELSAYAVGSTGYVTICFDDGWDDTYDNGKLKMDAYGYRGTAFIISELLGTTGYMTQAQIDELDRLGWDISGHGINNLVTSDSDDRKADLLAQKKYLSTHGYRGKELYAYPNGAYNQQVIRDLQKHFSVARTIDANHIATTGFNAMLLPSHTVVNTDTTGALEDMIDNAIANKDWLILVFHKIVTTPSAETEYATADFGTVIDYLDTNNVAVLPMSEVLRRL